MRADLLKLIAARIGTALVTLFVVSAIVFAITAVLPGDAAQEQLGQEATPEALAALRQQMGLDQSAAVRYGQWLAGVARGNPGESMINHVPVRSLVASRLPNTLMLALVTAGIAVPIALALGVAAALWRGSVFDRAMSMATVAVVSVPEFLVATVAVIVFAVKLHWLPALAYASDVSSLAQMLKSFAMPVVTLCCVIIAQMLRLTRAAVIDQLREPYIEMVRLKGASPWRMVLVHALPNAVGPIANSIALSISYLLGGVIIIEVIFNYPGLARLMVDAVSQRDMPVVQTCAMVFCTGYLLLVTAADVLGIVTNPRLRYR